MKLLVKICGMRDMENIRQVAEASPDYMGFIFYPPSPRYVGEDFIIPEDFPPSVGRVGVFVNETTENILEVATRNDIKYIQLHGSETIELCSELKSTGVYVIKVFSVGENFDFSLLIPYKSVVDYFMFDTKGLLFGGNAKPFNWKLLENYTLDIPFFLSGGISPDNVSEVSKLTHLNLHAIDVNSGVEYQPGIKDANKINSLMENLRS